MGISQELHTTLTERIARGDWSGSEAHLLHARSASFAGSPRIYRRGLYIGVGSGIDAKADLDAGRVGEIVGIDPYGARDGDHPCG
jgi:hypothetical protein